MLRSQPHTTTYNFRTKTKTKSKRQKKDKSFLFLFYFFIEEERHKLINRRKHQFRPPLFNFQHLLKRIKLGCVLILKMQNVTLLHDKIGVKRTMCHVSFRFLERFCPICHVVDVTEIFNVG